MTVFTYIPVNSALPFYTIIRICYFLVTVILDLLGYDKCTEIEKESWSISIEDPVVVIAILNIP